MLMNDSAECEICNPPHSWQYLNGRQGLKRSAFCRCADVPWVFKSIRDFCHMLVIIPGPAEPACLDPYVEELFQDFKRYGPEGMP